MTGFLAAASLLLHALSFFAGGSGGHELTGYLFFGLIGLAVLSADRLGGSRGDAPSRARFAASYLFAGLAGVICWTGGVVLGHFFHLSLSAPVIGAVAIAGVGASFGAAKLHGRGRRVTG